MAESAETASTLSVEDPLVAKLPGRIKGTSVVAAVEYVRADVEVALREEMSVRHCLVSQSQS